MKTYFFAAILLATIAGCVNTSDNRVENEAKEAKANRSKRNISINRHNSYSDLFLDSNQVEQFITHQNLNDTATKGFRSFYNARNFQFAWFGSDGLTEQALAFRSLYDYDDTSNARKKLDRILDSLMAEDELHIVASDPVAVKTELLLTWRFINYLKNRYTDEDLRQLALTHLVPAQKQEVLAMADAILDGDKGNKIIDNAWYITLRKQLGKYVSYAKKGGWEPLPVPRKKIKKGGHDKFITSLKKRLAQTEDWKQSDTTAAFTPELEAVIKKIQQQYGYKPDGTISSSFIHDLNVPAIARVQQLLINLERMRWMPASVKGRLIMVNIPEYEMHVREGNDSVFNTAIVVGKEGHSTIMFSGNLNQVVFSPYWNLPPSIVRKEVLPEVQKNTHYLAEHDMEITGEEDGLPVIRQLPGDKNELGKIKFLFPNSFNIYFHDTPHKELFNRSNRAFSHGCIRVSEPKKLAEFLLQDQPEWTDERMDSAMNGGKEIFVKVKKPVPVLIYYYTAWADEDGKIQWREDIYKHDSKMAEKLFTNAQVFPPKVLASAR